MRAERVLARGVSPARPGPVPGRATACCFASRSWGYGAAGRGCPRPGAVGGIPGVAERPGFPVIAGLPGRQRAAPALAVEGTDVAHAVFVGVNLHDLVAGLVGYIYHSA